MMMKDYIESAIKQFKYYRYLSEQTFAQLKDDDLFWKYNSESNSIANIAKHMAGNMLSRWTDFLTTDGEKEWRNRDEEFETAFSSRDEMMEYWNKGWDCLMNALSSITEADFNKTVYIRNQGHSVVDAINRQLAHYPYHVGQIVFIGKMLQNEEWKSLSIPKGKSRSFNKEKFEKPKHMEHFTDEVLKRKNED